MLKIELEFRKGILFVRLNGKLNKYTKNKLDEEVLPVILKHGIVNLVINLDKLTSIDTYGINALININSVVYSLNGKLIVCSISNDEVKNKLNNKEYVSKFYEVSNELMALGVINIWQKV